MIIIHTELGKESIPADTVIVAVGSQSVDDLSREVNRGGTGGDHDRRRQGAKEDYRCRQRRFRYGLKDLNSMPSGCLTQWGQAF